MFLGKGKSHIEGYLGNILVCLTSLLRIGGGDGQVVSVLALYSDNPCSNPAEIYIYL